MYYIIENISGMIIDKAEVNAPTRKMLEECGFTCKKVD